MESNNKELTDEQIQAHLLNMRSEITSFHRGLSLLELQSEKDRTDKVLLGPIIDFLKNYINLKQQLIQRGQEILKSIDKK